MLVVMVMMMMMAVVMMMVVWCQSAPFQWKAESGPIAHCTVVSLTGLAPVPGCRRGCGDELLLCTSCIWSVWEG